ncbi:hypothetical protein XvhCFBP2543_15405 [Xanthomonas vasicola]|nr:hypothetical protein XvhCFBP2543_15405 [Xanthomonas vasicola]
MHEASPRTPTPTSAARPGPRLRRGRCKARAPVARMLCLLAPVGERINDWQSMRRVRQKNAEHSRACATCAPSL